MNGTGVAVELSPELKQLGLALGLLRLTNSSDPDSWVFDDGFFSDPAGALGGVMTDPVQREAALTLAATLLGSAAQEADIPELRSGQTWVPIVQEASAALYAVVEVAGDVIDVGIAGRAAHTDASAGATISASAWLPLVRISDGAESALLPGTADGTLRLGVAVDLPPADPNDVVALGGVSLEITVPTAGGDPSISMRLRDLRLAAWPEPREVVLSDDFGQAGAELIEILIDLVTATAGLDPAARQKLWQLLTLVGLGDTEKVPALPIDDVIKRGAPAVRDWASAIISDATGQNQSAWLTALARFLGVTSSSPITAAGTSGPFMLCLAPAPGIQVCVHLSLAAVEGTTAATIGLSGNLEATAPTTISGALSARCDLATLVSSSPLQVTWLPQLVAEVVLGRDGDPLVETPSGSPTFRVETLHVGVVADPSHEMRLIVEARDVIVNGVSYPALDLSSVDAVTQAASSAGANALSTVLTDLLGGAVAQRRAQAFLALLGLLRPVGLTSTAPWPALVDATKLFTDPLGEIGRFHARVFGQGAYSTMAGEALELLDASATPLAGAGTAGDPWRLVLPPVAGSDPDERARLEVLIWGSGTATNPVAHFGAGVVFEPIALDDYELELLTLHELARVALPTTEPDVPSATFVDRHELRVKLHQDLFLDSGPLVIEFERLDAALWWERGHGWDGRVSITGASVAVEQVSIALPDPFTFDASTSLSLPAAGDPLWGAFTALLGARIALRGFDQPSLSFGEIMAALAGWLPPIRPLHVTLPDGSELDLDLPELSLPEWPTLSLSDLISDPPSAMRTWLAALFASTGSSDFSVPTIGLARALLGIEAPEVRGSGVYDDPWALPVDTTEGAPELVAWLDPDGPTLAGMDDAFADLLPRDLIDALAGTGDLPTYGELVSILRRAATFEPNLGALLSGRDDVVQALEDVRARVLDGDGLVPAAAQMLPGDTRSPTELRVTHLGAPARFSLSDHSSADPASVVYVCAPLPGVKKWSGQPADTDPHVVDLRAAGLPPEAFDLSQLPATGPWFLLAPTRAAAGVDSQALGGYDGVVARIRRAVDAIAAAAGATPTIVAHSIAAHAARELWAAGEVDELITVCAPTTAAGLDVLGRIDLAGAIRFLRALAGRVPQPHPTGLDPLLELLATYEPALEDALEGPDGVLRRVPFPSEDFVPPPTPTAAATATPVTAVVGRLTEAEIDTAVAEAVRSVVSSVLKNLPVQGPARAPVTHLGVGFQFQRPPQPADAGVPCELSARVDLHRFRLRSGTSARPVPRLHARLALRRPGGWLVGGPQRAATQQTTARVRWAEFLLTADPQLGDVHAEVVLHDAALFGLSHGRRIVDGSSIDAVARTLLGELGAALSPVPATGPVADAVALLEALGVVQVDAAGTVTFDADALERLVGDPAGWLRTRALDPQTPALLEGALRRVFGAPATGPLRATLVSGLAIEFDLSHGRIALVAEGSGVVLGDVLRVTGRVETGVTGAVRAALRVEPSRAPGPGGAVALELAADTSASIPVTALLDTGGDIVSLLPTVDAVAVGRRVAIAALGQVVALVLDWARQIDADLAPVLRAAGILDASDRVRDPMTLFLDPGAWVIHPDALGSVARPGSLSPARVAALTSAVADLVDGELPSGALALPRGAHLVAKADGDDLLVTLILSQQRDDGTGAMVGSHFAVVARVDPGLVLSIGLEGRVRRTASTGALAAGELQVTVDEDVSVVARLRAAGASQDTVIELFPTCSGLGPLADIATSAAIDHVLPELLEGLASMGQPGSELADVADALGDLGTALGLRDPSTGAFSIAQLRLLAQDPPAELGARFRTNPTAVISALTDLTRLIGGTPTSGDHLWASASNHVLVDLGSTSTGAPQLTVQLVDLSPLNGIEAGATIVVSPDGLGASRLWMNAVEADVMAADPVTLLPGAWPFVELRLGGATPSDPERVELGLWLDDESAATRDALVARARFDGGVALVHRRVDSTGTIDSSDLEDAVVELVRDVVVPVALDALLSLQEMSDLLSTAVGSSDIGTILKDSLVLRDSPWRVASDLMDELPDRAISAATKLLHAALDAALGGVELGPFELTLTGTSTGDGATRYRLGASLTEALELPPAGGVVLSIGTPQTWSDLPMGAAHLEVDLVELPDDLGSGGAVEFTPGVRVAGLGVRVAGEDGPLFDFGIRLQGLAVYGAYRRDQTGFVDGGARLDLEGLSLPLAAAAGGDNPVAAKVVNPGGAGDPEPIAPTFSPQLVIFKTGYQPPIVAIRLGEGDGPWWIPIQRSFGPLYIEQVGLDVDGEPSPEEISVLVDGGVSLAGLSVGVDDLSLTIPFDSAGDVSTWRLDLAGLAVAFDGKGVAIAGGLRKMERDGGVEYTGMLMVRAADFGLTAIGAYGEFPIPNSSERYTSMFVFAALAAPLGGPPAFFVMGVGAGVGLNRRLVAPQEMTQVTSFPLVAAMDPNSTLITQPMQALAQLGQTFPPERGAFWFAAGVRFTSFTVVESIAVLTVAISDDVEVMLLGLSRAGLPNAMAPIAQIELALKARFSAREAVLSVRAQLTDNSWLLNPSCRLTGGFAFVIWFRTGEFVLTLGGYHPTFNRPAHYPAVPRLGFAWSVSSAIAVKGESYFALTPSCVMAGGRLEASYNAGIVRASFAAGMDAIVSWDPFFYDVRIYITVSAGVQIVIDLGWFGKVRITVSLSVGAELHVWGPRLRGEASVDLDVTSITVRFGATDSPAGNEPLGWAAFHDKYLVTGDPDGVIMQLAVTEGQFVPDPGGPPSDPDNGSAARPFRVLPEFALRSTTRAASNRVNGHLLSGPPLDLAPMRKVNVISTHTITVLRNGSPVSGGTVVPVTGHVPDGVWRVLPESSAGEGGVRTAYLGANLWAPVTWGAATPTSSATQVETGSPHVLPLLDERDPNGELSDAMEAAEQWASGQSWSDPLAAAQQLMMSPSAALAARVGKTVGRAIARGPSHFEVLLLPAERASPPRLERITAGLVAKQKSPVVVTPKVRPAVPAEQPSPVEPPLVTGLFRPRPSSAARLRRRTTVGRWAARLPRRHTDTLDGVRAGTRPVGTQLHRVSPPPVEAVSGATLVGRDVLRSFSRVAGTVEVRRSLTSGWGRAGVLEELEKRLPSGIPVRAGEVHVLHLAGAAFDYDDQRPWFEIEGDQMLRVVVLDRIGGVLADATVDRGRVDVPVGAYRVALIGTGMKSWPAGGGVWGWHAGDQVLQISESGYVVAGGALRTSSPHTTRARRPVDVALVTGSDAAGDRGLTETDLPAGTRSAVLVLRAGAADPTAAEVLLGLDGAEQERDAAGAPLPPVVIAAGDRAYLTYSLRPSNEVVTVTVGNEEGWVLEGVLGGECSAEVLARWLLERGVDGIVAGLVRRNSRRSNVTWRGVTP